MLFCYEAVWVCLLLFLRLGELWLQLPAGTLAAGQNNRLLLFAQDANQNVTDGFPDPELKSLLSGELRWTAILKAKSMQQQRKRGCHDFSLGYKKCITGIMLRVKEWILHYCEYHSDRLTRLNANNNAEWDAEFSHEISRQSQVSLNEDA